MKRKSYLALLAICAALAANGCGSSGQQTTTPPEGAVITEGGLDESQQSSENVQDKDDVLGSVELPGDRTEKAQDSEETMDEKDAEDNDVGNRESGDEEGDVENNEIRTANTSSAAMLAKYRASSGTGYAAQHLNIRSDPGTGSPIIGTIPYAGACTIMGTEGGWTKVNYNGMEGFCAGNYILSVPPYSINDSTEAVAGIAESKGGASQSWVNRLNSVLSNVPQNILNNLANSRWHIYATGEDINAVYMGGGSPGAAGATNFTSAYIVVECSDPGMNSSALHEMGHYLDFACGYPSLTSEFTDIYNAEAAAFRAGIKDPWNVSTPKDFFAETFKYLCTDKSKCTERAAEFVSRYMSIPQ